VSASVANVEACDLLVVGAGPAGIAAACVAASHGLSVVVADQGDLPGGQIWRGQSPDGEGLVWRKRFIRSGARFLPRASVLDLRGDEQSVIATVEDETGAGVIRAGHVLIATGARELLLPFPGWTLPWVLGAGGAQALLKSGMDVSGKRAIVAGTGPLILAVAAMLRDSGARVLRVLEQASLASATRFSTMLWRAPHMLTQASQLGSRVGVARYRTSAWVVAAHGDDRLRAVTFRDPFGTRTMDCDVLCNGMGLVPSTELARLAGCEIRPAAGGVGVDHVQRTNVPRVFAAGEAVGVGGAALATVQGMIVGYTVAGRDIPTEFFARRARLAVIANQMLRSFAPRDALRDVTTPETLVCRCEDVPLAAVSPYDSARAAKLYTRCGMGPCQGRVCGAAMQFLRGWEPDTIRQPVQPARVSTLTSAH
jgi:NADPH-dependent 2,4-dienoyl-CoA reductase/sulfur reductase-like enzyme